MLLIYFHHSQVVHHCGFY